MHGEEAQVIQEERYTAHIAEVADATQNVSKRDWLDWALDFAYEDLEHLKPDKREYWRRGLKQFLMAQGPGVAGDPDVELASDLQMKIIQARFVDMIQHILAGRPVELGTYMLDVRISVHHGRPWLIEHVDLGALPDEGQVPYAFARVLDRVSRDLLDEGYEGPFIKVCPAPKPRRKELCGRWFIGRPNRMYCSPHCQNRATTRASRARHQTAAASH
jgi:hypothetical protein